MIRLDDLHIDGLKIYQQTDGFRFGTDAVLLAWFAAEKRFRNVVDLCCGNGIIPLILSARAHNASICGVEILEEPVKLANMSFEYNGLQDRLRIINGDLRLLKEEKYLPHASFDLVTANPPYSAEGTGFVSDGDRGTARTELCCTSEDVATAAAYLLKNSGRLCVINRPERMADIVCAMRNAGIEPKRIMYVCSKPDIAPTMMMIEGVKGGKSGIKTEPLLEITDRNGKYTAKICEIYGFDKNGKYDG